MVMSRIAETYRKGPGECLIADHGVKVGNTADEGKVINDFGIALVICTHEHGEVHVIIPMDIAEGVAMSILSHIPDKHRSKTQ